MKWIFLLLICIIFINFAFGQKKEKPTICSDCGFPLNGKAICLPKPKYPAAAKAVRASGDVQVQVIIDEKGKVIEAKAVTGHPLLKVNAEKAAKQAKFEPVSIGGKAIRVTGVIVYKFSLADKEPLPDVLSDKPEQLGNLNSLASYLPMPKSPLTGNYKGSKNSSIGVQVKVDLQTGEVIEASAIYGHPLFRKSAENAALQAKFHFKDRLFCSKFGIGILEYKVKDFFGNEKILNTQKTVNKKAIYLPEPTFENLMMGGKHLHLTKDEIVKVEIIVDAQGNVNDARAVSGHPFLRQACENAARKTKFSAINDVGKLKIRAILIYTIKPNGEVEM